MSEQQGSSKSEASVAHLSLENELLKEEIRSLKSRLLTQSSLASEGCEREESLSESAMIELRRALIDRKDRLMRMKTRIDFELRDIELQLEIMQFSATSKDKKGDKSTKRLSSREKSKSDQQKRSVKRGKKGKTSQVISSTKSLRPH